MASIILIERHRAGHDSFGEALRKRFPVTIAASGKQALRTAAAQKPTLIIIDAVSMRSPGDRIAKQLKSALPEVPVLLLRDAAGESAADAIVASPVTARRVLNAVSRLVRTPEDSTGASERVLRVGPFELNLSRRVLTAHAQETPLTPKLALLIEQFFLQPGQVLSRSLLMERVWKTSYMGDTRTLDVHIRWFRRAIERDPAHPIYLKTVRGTGYRLDLPPA